MKWAPLNIFQKTQRLWDTIHPYNAAQLVELHTIRPADQIKAAFQQALRDRRLGAVTCDGSAYFVERRGGKRSVSFAETSEALDQLITRLINEPFGADRSMPFRPFIHARDGRQTIGVIYQHWVADSVSVRLLMHQWVMRLIGGGGTAAVVLPSGGMWRYFSPTVAGWSPVAQFFGLLGYAARMKTMRRIETRSEMHDVAVTIRPLPAGLIGRVRERARAAGATVGDVFIAAAAEAVSGHGSNAATPRRTGIALGTIVDIRTRSRIVPPNVFGLFLGFTMTSFAGSELSDFGRLLQRAARQRQADLRTRAAEASQFNMLIGYAIARWKRRASLLEFYRKRFPLAGGLSNVNLGPEWAKRLHPNPIARYHRVSPAGPLMPLVLTPTTLADELSLCCTYRSSIVSAEQIEAVIESFTQRLVTFASADSARPGC